MHMQSMWPCAILFINIIAEPELAVGHLLVMHRMYASLINNYFNNLTISNYVFNRDAQLPARIPQACN